MGVCISHVFLRRGVGCAIIYESKPCFGLQAAGFRAFAFGGVELPCVCFQFGRCTVWQEWRCGGSGGPAAVGVYIYIYMYGLGLDGTYACLLVHAMLVLETHVAFREVS